MSGERVEKIIRDAKLNLWLAITGGDSSKESREYSVVLAKMDEALFYARQAIAVIEQRRSKE